MKPFEHIDAKTVDEAVGLLREYESKLIAGGTDLLGVLKDRVLPTYPELLVNIKSIPGLDRIEQGEGGIEIGALAKLADVAASPLVKEEVPLLAEAAFSVATPQIRNMGTIGGNLAQDTRCWYYRYPREIGGNIICRRKGGGSCPAATGENRYHAIFPGKQCLAVCPSDTAIALVALGATLQIAGPDGQRTVPVEDFYQPLGNTLNSDEMITAIQVPQPPKGARQTFLKHRVREAVDFAIVSVAAVVTEKDGKCEDARIVLGAVAEQAINGKPIDRANAEAAAEAAVASAVPLSENAYKVAITRTLVKRALVCRQ
jgi:xanthine dehydrogenase YagS FAD-binding subunit